MMIFEITRSVNRMNGLFHVLNILSILVILKSNESYNFDYPLIRNYSTILQNKSAVVCIALNHHKSVYLRWLHQTDTQVSTILCQRGWIE